MLKLDVNFQKLNEGEKQTEKTVVARKLIVEFCIKKILVNLLEAANLSQDLVNGLRQRLGSFGPDHIDLDIRYKGIQFLQFEISKIGCMLVNH